MEVFECQGWLHITVNDNEDHILVKLKHPEAHDKYINIDIPEDVKGFIKNNIQLTTTQVRKGVTLIYILRLSSLISSGARSSSFTRPSASHERQSMLSGTRLPPRNGKRMPMK